MISSARRASTARCWGSRRSPVTSGSTLTMSAGAACCSSSGAVSRSRPCGCRAVPSRPTMVTVRCISRLRSVATSWWNGRHGLPRTALQSRGAPNGRAAAKASISAIPMGTFWSWRHRDCGQFTKIRAWNRCSFASGALHNRAFVAMLGARFRPGLEPGEGVRNGEAKTSGSPAHGSRRRPHQVRDGERGQGGRGRARRSQERRLRRHDLHHGICRRGRARRRGGRGQGRARADRSQGDPVSDRHRDGLQDRQARGAVRVQQPEPDLDLRLRRVGAAQAGGGGRSRRALVTPDDIQELFSVFGVVAVRRMFGGAGIYADGTMFALVADGVIYLKADELSTPAFERENLPPFTYETKDGRRGVMSYRRMPERLYDDPDELATWAHAALAAAQRSGKKRASGKAAGKTTAGKKS